MAEVEFNGQKEDEVVLFAIKQTPLIFFPSIMKVITLILIEVLLFKFSFMTAWDNYNILFSFSFYIVLIWSFYILLSAWYMWANTVYVLTNDRVISVMQKGWFDRVVGEATLTNILFISHKIKGPLQTLFNFGSIHIRASGVTEEELVLANVRDPYNNQQQVVAAQKKYSQQQASTEEESENREFWKQKKEKPLIH